ncbi:MAG: leucine-rich repeat domain-containing protein [Pseudobacter sp.]|uniref:leucine-rich repeat domain-containing protein n=1 Tax=Pseudobacter sp. TaxID=2045420 RepID=UPI003F823555
MKIILTVSVLLMQIIATAQVVRIPDHNFKQRLIALGIDTNDDNQIQVSEAQKVTQLYVNDLGIVNLEGINSFTNLEEFGCYNNKLQSLDLSKCKKLRMLYAGNNRITNLNIAGLTKLEELFVENNYLLANLDISGLTALKKVKLMKNKIGKLDVSALKELEELEIQDNNIEKAVVRGAAKLKLLNLENNPIKVTVDIRGLTELEYCNFLGCNLLFINFSGTVKLRKCDW